MAQDAFADVQDQHDHGFLGWIEPVSLWDVGSPVGSCSLRGVDGVCHGLAFPDTHDFEFVGGVGVDGWHTRVGVDGCGEDLADR